MDLTPKSGKNTAGAVGAEKGQGDDAKDKPNLKKGKAKAQSSADGTGTTGPVKELHLKMGACSLETAREESQAKRRAAWKEEVKKELQKRAELKRKMEAVPIEQVTKWEDKQSMSKMSTEWREGFKKERTRFLFNEVFPLLLKTPEIFTVNDVLMCRWATKAWKETIDHCLSTTLESFIPYRTKLGNLSYYYFPQCFSWFPVNSRQLLNQNGYAKALDIKNPFFSRKLLIGSSSDRPRNGEYWSEMEDLVQRYGREIWMVEIHITPGMGVELMYETLAKFLTFMPNLRSLEIVDQKRKIAKVDKQKALGKEVFQPLKELMARKPLPELPLLRRFMANKFLPDPIVSAILTKYRDSLEFVHLERSESDRGKFQMVKGIPNLKQFFLSGWMSPTLDFPLLEEMSVEGYVAKDVKDVVEFFRIFYSRGSTLRRLRLMMSFHNPDRFLRGSVRLKLPLLERLELDVDCGPFMNIDFLLELGSLKELDLRYGKCSPVGILPNRETFSIRSSPLEGATIQFAGFEDRLDKSNIWKLLPELKLVSIKVTAITLEVLGVARGGITGMMARPVFEKIVTCTRDGRKFEGVL